MWFPVDINPPQAQYDLAGMSGDFFGASQVSFMGTGGEYQSRAEDSNMLKDVIKDAMSGWTFEIVDGEARITTSL